MSKIAILEKLATQPHLTIDMLDDKEIEILESVDSTEDDFNFTLSINAPMG
ncbi:MAG: hypothetical protein GYB58_11055 [Gammaproteobacteria bacterium]|jgi:hypothetical protein|uniref:hypothetical protein n=1 Tax=Alteromonas alba TaxID=2079529 RepID=UPI0014782C55|nr:hypothetical protein [Alteromonas alba]MBR9792271.1 hypothetical protein [Gammaproteobacteria bacterium]|tara:strand:+ start:436 stop:588 length:153 start_codon:yes stop_codon:yes gene_type:complete